MPGLPTGTVTFLFTDIEGATRLLKHLGDRYVDVLTGYRRFLRSSVQERGGQEERTAESHVQHILDKLEFSSRSQIAAWAVERELHRPSQG